LPHVAGVPALTLQLRYGRGSHSPRYRLSTFSPCRFHLSDHFQSYQIEILAGTPADTALSWGDVQHLNGWGQFLVAIGDHSAVTACLDSLNSASAFSFALISLATLDDRTIVSEQLPTQVTAAASKGG